MSNGTDMDEQNLPTVCCCRVQSLRQEVARDGAGEVGSSQGTRTSYAVLRKVRQQGASKGFRRGHDPVRSMGNGRLA